jgi:hypothetical protein
MVAVPWPLSNSPGRKPQEGSGRLINVFAEPRGEGEGAVWRRAPGASVFARTPSVGSAIGRATVLGRGQTLLSTFFELVASSTYQLGAASTSSISYPTGTESGDVVFIANVVSANAASTWAAPSGFTALISDHFNSTGMYSTLFYKASTGESAVSIVNPSTIAGAGLAFSIRGAMSTAPICDVGNSGLVTTGAAGDPDPPNTPATTADSLAVAVGWLDDDAITTVTAPTSFGHPLFNASTSASVMVAFQPRPTTGSVTVSSFDTDGTDEWAAFAFTIRHD